MRKASPDTIDFIKANKRRVSDYSATIRLIAIGRIYPILLATQIEVELDSLAGKRGYFREQIN
jgi:hypothetical protein